MGRGQSILPLARLLRARRLGLIRAEVAEPMHFREALHPVLLGEFLAVKGSVTHFRIFPAQFAVGCW